MKYRSDIDGMRCLAVVSVILFHLNEKIVPGGFTGVDIFFVISGFLITRIIVDGLRAGDFSMSRFYARRVRRIFPALFTVLLSSTLLAVVAFEPEAYKHFLTICLTQFFRHQIFYLYSRLVTLKQQLKRLLFFIPGRSGWRSSFI